MIYKNANVLLPSGFSTADFEVIDKKFGRIEEFIDSKDFIDLSSKTVIPGLFDIHTHGCLSVDFTDCKMGDIQKAKNFYYKNGVTSILATLMSESEEKLAKSLEIIANSDDDGFIQGINLEGPFFKKDKKGAHNEKVLCKPNCNMIERLNELCNNKIKLISVDPDYENANEFISQASQKYTISLGHTNCNFETASKAIKSGANHITHLFNAMHSFNHREPGLVGAMMEKGVYSELICDFIHIHPSVIKLVFSANPDYSVIISDSISPTGNPDGSYISGGMNVIFKNGKACLENGTIAGSTTNLFDEIKNLESIGIDFETSIKCATENPAKSVGLDEQIGAVKCGLSADFIVLDSKKNIEKVYKSGQIVYQK